MAAFGSLLIPKSINRHVEEGTKVERVGEHPREEM